MTEHTTTHDELIIERYCEGWCHDSGAPGKFDDCAGCEFANALSAQQREPVVSHPSPDVSVDELALALGNIERARQGLNPMDSITGFGWERIRSQARALLARFRIERLDRLAKSGRR